MMTTGGTGAGTPTTVPPGLSTDEADAALVTHGPNIITEPKRHGVLWRVGRQLRDPMILLLLAAASITTTQGDGADTFVIALVVVLNTAVGVVQELRAERAITALRQMAAPLARVLRDGHETVVPAAYVVPGDVLRLDAGDVVPADAGVLETVQLQCDESALTGESVPVNKDTGSEATVNAGTTVTRGHAWVLVTRTGPQSALGRIAALVAGTRSRPTPLQRRLGALGTQLSVGALALSGVVLILGVARGRGLGEMALTAVSLSVAAVPESLPAVVTLALALGARRMAHRSALVRGLPAVETLGSVSVLATDKTGTLTENRMVVQRLLTAAGEYDVSGTGYGPIGHVRRRVDTATLAGEDLRLAELMRDVSLCNDANVTPPGDQHPDWRPVGDPTEAALVSLAAKFGVDVAGTRTTFPRVDELPFESSRGWMATAHAAGDGSLVIYKGAPEFLLSTLRHAGGASTGPELSTDSASQWAERCSRDGLRVLAVLDASLADGEPGDVDLEALIRADSPFALRLVGLVAMADPPRADVSSVVTSLQRAGIRLLLITGDHPTTAAAVAAQVGLSGGSPITGRELSHGSAAASAQGTSVFARIRPEQKLDIIRSLQREGHVVAMTGDGVNDAPALRAADIGVAMGRDGTEVARQAADLVLTDDRLATVAVAVEEGRRIHDNVRRFLRYALSGGVAEIVFMLVAPFVGFPVPLLPAQILWVNMLTHGLPGVAFGADPADPGAMDRPPRPAGEAILGAGLGRQIMAAGALIASVTLGAAVWARSADVPWQTVAFLVLGLSQLGVALGTRQRAASGPRNWFLDISVAVALVLQVAAVYARPLQDLLGTHTIPWGELPIPVLLAAVPGLTLWALRSGREAMHGSRPRPPGPSPLGRRHSCRRRTNSWSPLEIEERAVPEPSPRQVLVRIVGAWPRLLQQGQRIRHCGAKGTAGPSAQYLRLCRLQTQFEQSGREESRRKA